MNHLWYFLSTQDPRITVSIRRRESLFLKNDDRAIFAAWQVT
jgi:hypothetical protein